GAWVARATAMAKMASGDAAPVATTSPSAISFAIAATSHSAAVGASWFNTLTPAQPPPAWRCWGEAGARPTVFLGIRARVPLRPAGGTAPGAPRPGNTARGIPWDEPPWGAAR